MDEQNQVLKNELERMAKLGHPIAVVFKPKVTSTVVVALDAMSDMVDQDRIKVLDSDVEKMRQARFSLRWNKKDGHGRTIIFWPGKLFKSGVFLTRVAPAIQELREHRGPF